MRLRGVDLQPTVVGVRRVSEDLGGGEREKRAREIICSSQRLFFSELVFRCSRCSLRGGV